MTVDLLVDWNVRYHATFTARRHAFTAQPT